MFGMALAAVSFSLLAADQQGDRPHVLVAVAEALVQRNLGDAASIVVRSALVSPGLTRTERARLRLADAARLAGADDEPGAKKQLGDALNLDPMVTFEFPVPARLKELLEDARSLLPPASGPVPPSSGIGREEPAAALIRVVDLLYANAPPEAADLVLQIGWQYAPFTQAEVVQLEVRRGIVKADQFNDAEARDAFKMALDLDRAAKLPDWAPPKTIRQFEEMRAALPAPAPVPVDKAPAPPPPTQPVVKAPRPTTEKPPASTEGEVKKTPVVAQVGPSPAPARPGRSSSPGAWKTPARPTAAPASGTPQPLVPAWNLSDLMPRHLWTLTAISGGALELVGGVLYLLAWRQYDLLATHSPTIAGPDQLQATADAGRALQIGAGLSVGVGAALLVASLSMHQYENTPRHEPLAPPARLKAAVQIGPGAVTISLSGSLQ